MLSDIGMCYTLLLRIKANVVGEDSRSVCEITGASTDHLSVFFYSLNSLKTQTGIHLSLGANISL